MNLLRKIMLVAWLPCVLVTNAHAGDASIYSGYFCWLDGSQVVPTSGLGQLGGGCLTLSGSNNLAGYVSWSDIQLATFAIIHGPAPEGQVGPILFVVPISGNSVAVNVTLDAQQLHDLGCGLLYVEVTSSLYPNGAVRGQIKALISGGAPNPCTLAVEEKSWGAVKVLYR